MSTDLEHLLRDSAARPRRGFDVEGAYRRGRRRRQAAQFAAGVASLAVVVAVVGVVGPWVRPQVLLGPGAAPTVVDGIVVDVAPGRLEVDRLERLQTVLPSTMELDSEQALPLSEAPVARALALSRKLDETRDDRADVFVVGEDGQLRVIDLANLQLIGDVDPQVIHRVEVLNTALSPDGTRVAFVHRDDEVASGVLVIDLTLAQARQFPFPEPVGFHARVIWRPDGSEIIVEDHELEQTALLNIQSGEVHIEPHSDATSPYGGLGAVATTQAPDHDVVRLSGMPDDEPALSRWTPDGELVARHVMTTTRLAPYGWDWGSPGWRHGDLVARTQRVGPQPEEGNVIFVFDLESGDPVRALHLAGSEVSPTGEMTFLGRGVDDSPVLGWLDEETVLLADAGVLAWNIHTGQLYLVSRVGGPAGVPIGYDAVGDLSH